MYRSILFTQALSMACFAFLATPASAVVVLQDNFDGVGDSDGDTLAGRSPNGVDPAINDYTLFNAATIESSVSVSAPNSAQVGTTQFAGNAALIDYAASAPTSGTVSLSLDTRINNIVGGSGTESPGIGLGFYDAAPVTDAWVNFTGFYVRRAGNNIELRFLNDGAAAEEGALVATIAGGVIPDGLNISFLPLSFSVDAGTGNLTALSYNGTDYLSDFNTNIGATTVLGVDNTVGFYGASNSTTSTGQVDNFTVDVAAAATTPVPEPATTVLLLIGLGLSGFSCFRSRRRK